MLPILQSYGLFSNFAPLKKRGKIGFLLAVKVITTIGVGIYLYSKIKSGTFNIDYTAANPWYLLAAFALTPLNWLVESLKWKILAAQVESISTWTAVKATLSGLASSVITPFRLGDPVGKVLFLQEGNRVQGAFLSVTGSLLQLAVTIIAGVVGLVAVSFSMAADMFSSYYYTGILVIAVATVAGVAAFFYIKKKHAETLKATLEIGIKKLATVFLLSSFRYALFIVQFMLVFFAYGDFNPLTIAMLVPVYFFVAAFVPMFIVTEGPTRGAIALAVFIGLGHAFSAATMVWIINLLIPAVIGLIFIWQHKSKNPTVEPVNLQPEN